MALVSQSINLNLERNCDCEARTTCWILSSAVDEITIPKALTPPSQICNGGDHDNSALADDIFVLVQNKSLDTRFQWHQHLIRVWPWRGTLLLSESWMTSLPDGHSVLCFPWSSNWSIIRLCTIFLMTKCVMHVLEQYFWFWEYRKAYLRSKEIRKKSSICLDVPKHHIL